MNKKTIYLTLLLAWPLIASLVSFWVHASMLISIILFLIFPSVFMSVIYKRSIKKALVFSVTISLPVAIVIDYIIHLNKQWFVLSEFPRLLGLVPIEDLIWGIFMGYLTIMFYEYFFDHYNKNKIWGRRMNQMALLFGSLLFAFLVIYQWFHYLLYIPYFYFWFGIVLVATPLILELIRRPKLIIKILPVSAYFFFFSFVYEITALSLEQWTFPGDQYIGWVSILGIGFPFEEFFFWFVLFAAAVVCYYEFFDDDEK